MRRYVDAVTAFCWYDRYSSTNSSKVRLSCFTYRHVENRASLIRACNTSVACFRVAVVFFIEYHRNFLCLPCQRLYVTFYKSYLSILHFFSPHSIILLKKVYKNNSLQRTIVPLAYGCPEVIQCACLGRVSSEHASAPVVDWCPVRRGGFDLTKM